jgi:hypothetical protein
VVQLLAALILILAAALPTSAQTTNTLKLLSVKKIWNAAHHNAFTDLTRFNNHWFCTFREAQGHINGNGKIRVIVSTDGDTWKSAALLEENGIDLRDPKLSVTPDNRLMLTLGGSVYHDKKLVERQPRVTFSKDGTNWSALQRVLTKSDWLWRVTWHKGHAYGTVYYSAANGEALRLVESTDGIHYKTVSNFKITNRPNEATARFLANDDCVILVRREGEPKGVGNRNAWIGTAHPPYTDWSWHDSGMSVGGPDFIVLPNGKMIASGRKSADKPADVRTFVGWMTDRSVTPDVTLPSSGDCSYPGMVWHDNTLWLTYYSSHEDHTSIYLAKVAVNLD